MGCFAAPTVAPQVKVFFLKGLVKNRLGIFIFLKEVEDIFQEEDGPGVIFIANPLAQKTIQGIFIHTDSGNPVLGQVAAQVVVAQVAFFRHDMVAVDKKQNRRLLVCRQVDLAGQGGPG